MAKRTNMWESNPVITEIKNAPLLKLPQTTEEVIARNSEPLPLAKRDETLPCALFLFIGKCMEMIV